MPTNRRLIDRSGTDFYPTPEWVTRALLDREEFSGKIWEPACGDGAMARVLRSTKCAVVASDLYDHGYGRSGVDFLRTRRTVPNIVTNPPYHLSEDFVHAALRQATRKVALILRLAFLESGGRYQTIFSTRPPARVHVFSPRVTFYPKHATRRGSGTTAYAWFVWECPRPRPRPRPSRTELLWIGPQARPGLGR